MARLENSSIIKFIFFGNYFYGICAIALSIEAVLQQQFPLNSLMFYVMVFATTILFYTKAYMPHKAPGTANKRSLWYYHNRRLMFYSQLLLTIILAACTAVFARNNWDAVINLYPLEWGLIMAFPLAGAFYYGADNKALGKYNLRHIGWLKPFIIGFVWAGLVTIYPVMFQNMEHDQHYVITFLGGLLFLKNFMFVTVLCIMFDIKDYATDVNQHLYTFVARVGLRGTIFYILIPLCILGLGSFLTYGISHHFSLMKVLLNTIPFICLISVAYSLHRRKQIFYYLVLIDGLMLLKAICGTIAMVYF
jgi:hypothetical protein